MTSASSGSSWGVVTTSSAPTEALQAFIAYYISSGATEIVIFDDRCSYDDRQFTGLGKSVSIIKCDQHYWEAVGGRPINQEPRQVINANAALPMLSTNLVLHVDTDEFVYSPTMTLSEYFDRRRSALPLRIPPCEPLFLTTPETLGQVYSTSYFKKRLPNGDAGKELARKLYGPIGTTLLRGMQGHKGGKAAFPISADLNLGIHGGTYGDAKTEFDKDHDFVVCHFFASGLQDWISKLELRLRPERLEKALPARQQFLKHYKKARELGPEATLQLFANLNLYNDAKGCLLRKNGALLEANLNIPERMHSVFGARAGDLHAPFGPHASSQPTDSDPTGNSSRDWPAGK